MTFMIFMIRLIVVDDDDEFDEDENRFKMVKCDEWPV